jgi:predicted nucleic acid-binding protein
MKAVVDTNILIRALIKPQGPDDDMFIEAAIAGRVTYLVTGDKDLLTLKAFETVNIVTPHTFLVAF